MDNTLKIGAAVELSEPSININKTVFPYICWECNRPVLAREPYCLPGKLCRNCSLEFHS